MIKSLEQANTALRVVKESAAEREAKGDFTPDIEAFWDKQIKIAAGVQFVWAVRDSWGACTPQELANRLVALSAQVETEDDSDDNFFIGVATAVVDILRAELNISLA
jgi:hypothetical protein